MLRPVGTPIYAAPSANMTEYDSVSASLGAAIAYAMNCAYRARVSPRHPTWRRHTTLHAFPTQ